MLGLCPPSYPYSDLNIGNLIIGKYYWEGYNDHSKWGISANSTVLCYGDLNRMWSQRYRGGGGLCVNFPALYAVHKAIVQTVDACGSTSFRGNLEEN